MNIFTDNKNFYPTPAHLIEKMCEGVDFKNIKTILEPSAGKGDIVKYIIENKNKYKERYFGYDYSNTKEFDIDCIEKDENLQAILKDNEYRIIADDFLNFHTFKEYDLIIMNPPFDEGDKHLLKALEFNSNIICLLNAETLKNPYSNARKVLINKLEKLNASVEYIENAFMDSERKTPVEIALIKILKQEDNTSSIIIDDLEKTKITVDEDYSKINQIVSSDLIAQIVEQYNYEAQIGIKLIQEYKKCTPYILGSIKDGYGVNEPILELKLYNKDLTVNNYLLKLRTKYWTALFNNDQFVKKMPSNMISEYHNKISELKEYDFSVFNIEQIIKSVDKYLASSIEEKIIDLFDELSSRHSYSEYSKNIHLFNGWKTNSAYKINKRVVIPLMAFQDPRWYDKPKPDYDYKVKRKLSDIVKVLDFLDNGRTLDIDLEEVLKVAEHHQTSQKIELKYFYATFYKKGTCHLEFKDMELLKKFNIFGSRKKGWLPPSYAKASYDDMTPEEQSVINEFEGMKSYQETLKNRDFLLAEPKQQLLN